MERIQDLSPMQALEGVPVPAFIARQVAGDELEISAANGALQSLLHCIVAGSPVPIRNLTGQAHAQLSPHLSEALARGAPLQAVLTLDALPPPHAATLQVAPMECSAEGWPQVFGTVLPAPHPSSATGPAPDAAPLNDAEIAAAVPSVLFRLTRSGAGRVRVRHISAGARALLGLSAEELLRAPRQLLRLMPRTERQGLIRAIAHSAETLSPLRCRFATEQRGGTRWVACLATPRRLPDGEIVWNGVLHECNAMATEDGRRALEQVHSSVIEAMSEGVLVHDGEGRITTCNSAAERILGLSAAELHDRTAADPRWQYIAPNGNRFPWDAHPVAVTLRTGKPQHNVILGMHKPDGDACWLSVNSQPIYRSSHPVPAGAVVTLTDITAQRGAQSELARSEQRLELAIAASQDGIWEWNLQTREVFFSDQFKSLLGYEPQSMADSLDALLAALHAEDKERLLEALDDHWSSRAPLEIELRMTTRSGETRWYWLKGTTVWDEQGRPIRMAGSLADITAEKLSRLQLQATLDTAVDGIISIDERGMIQSFNYGAELIFGYGKDEVVGRNVSCLMTEEHRGMHDGYISEYLRTGTPTALQETGRELEARHKDGHVIPIELYVGETRLGNERFFTGVVRDITERKLAERQLVQAQKMEVVGQLTGGIAHDFNNLLTIIQGNTELLAVTPHLDEREQQLVVNITRAAARGAALTDRLLAFARRQPLDPDACNVNALVCELLEMLARTLGATVAVRTHLASELWPAFVDRAHLESALINLVLNARDAMAGGGTVEIATAPINAADAALQPEPGAPRDWVRISVADEGSGMEPAVAERVFEPFFTTKGVGRGTGLGLSMVYGFVTQSDGQVRLDSKPGVGTTVHLYLPRSPVSSCRPNGAGKSSSEPRGQGEQILVVEDDPDVAMYVRDVLGTWGYRVTCVESSDQALEVLRSPTPVDLLFTDVVLPAGMTGPRLGAHALALRPGLPIVYTSGYMGEDQHIADVTPLLRKPYHRPELLQRLAEALRDGAE